jgi:hypothetical protein
MRVFQTPDAMRYADDAARYYALNLAWLRGILFGDLPNATRHASPIKVRTHGQDSIDRDGYHANIVGRLDL